ncbi:glycosyltransferase [Aliikangiella sp. G2MR2-5]|uniref:glycosyltransferase n=1 Tax=Aliikangiella sp. G2MR2-5 TaxID=2788943 RepID=UPI0018AC6F9B|nr:glycosyltransferase [Aliikangiella sp. G2MR2-5]
MVKKHRRTVKQSLKWWWNTRVVGLWRVRLGGLFKNTASSPKTHFEFSKEATPLGEVDPEGITVILTAYRRTEYLAEQIKALREQTVKPKEIWVWTNKAPEELLDVSDIADRVVISNTNWLFWGRFSLANMARTGYVAFFDDDILPQPKWFENCLDTIRSGFDGILGGSGVILPKEGGYSSKNKVGWNGGHLTNTAQVDLVGHAWFMRKSYLNYIWREEPYTWDNGEDIHLSYMALKHGGIKTYVPPHPENDQSIWCCRPDFGKIVGRKNVATFKTAGHRNIRSEIVEKYAADGWQVLATLEGSEEQSSKSFPEELKKFNQMLKDQQQFSLVRFGDGEMMVINGEAIDLSKKCNGEHKYTPQNEDDEKYRKILEESLLFKNSQYFVGLPCRCCVGDEHCEKLRVQSRQDESQLTWANIFVNANYPAFLEETVECLKLNTNNIVCHQDADIAQLPFEINQNFRVAGNAWVNDYDRLLKELTEYIENSRVENEVFLFCAGVLSNMLIYQLSKQFPNNTYLDLGSVFDSIMGLGKTRRYLEGSRRRLKKVCVW